MHLAGVPIAIVGGGLIGLSWAALFRHFGADVSVWDPSDDALASLAARLVKPSEHLKRLYGPAVAGGRLLAKSSLGAAVADALLVQENGPESVSAKRELFRQVEASVGDDTIIASSTSSLTWSELVADATLPGRFVTAHPFNPPHLVPLVELYGNKSSTVERAAKIYEGARRVVVPLKKDATGHIANRLASALWREAVHIVAEGIADVESVDAALVHGPGLRWSVIGPHMAYHLGGGPGGLASYLKHLGASQERRWERLGNPKLTAEVCAALVAGVAREAQGRDVAELEVQRDEALIKALLARRGTIADSGLSHD